MFEAWQSAAAGAALVLFVQRPMQGRRLTKKSGHGVSIFVVLDFDGTEVQDMMGGNPIDSMF